MQNQVNQVSESPTTEIDTAFASKICEVLNEVVNVKVNEIVENQNIVNVEMYKNIKSIVERQEEESTQSDAQMKNFSKLIKYVSDDLDYTNKKISHLVETQHAALISQQNEIKIKDQQISELQTQINELKLKSEEFQNTFATYESQINILKNNILKSNTSGVSEIKSESKKSTISIDQFVDNLLNQSIKKVPEVKPEIKPKIEPEIKPTTSVTPALPTLPGMLTSYSGASGTSTGVFGIQKKISNEYTISQPLVDNTESKFLQRLERACTHKLSIEVIYITPKTITCQIIGTTDNIYVVSLVGVPACSCLDHEKNKHKCKHILYVVHKMLGMKNVNRDSFTYEELSSAIKSSKIAENVMVIKSCW